MAAVESGDIVISGANLLDYENDVEMRTDDEDEDKRNFEAEGKKHSGEDEAEEGELVEEGLEEPVFDEHRPLRRPNFKLHEPGKPLIELIGENLFKPNENIIENRSGGFVTGVDIFGKEEQEKLNKRAQRFGLDLNNAKPSTQKLVQKIYKSMGVNPGDTNIRFDTVHMKGTKTMTTQDVFDYFKDYAPASIEWISNSTCNVMWLDDISAARAMLGLSIRIKTASSKKDELKRVRRRRRRKSNEKSRDESVDENSDVADENKIIDNYNGNDSKRLYDDSDENDVSEDGNESDAISLCDIDVEVPSGLWRKGIDHPRSSCIFLRFATGEDHRAPKGSHTKEPDYSGYVGLISKSKRKRIQEQFRGIKFYDAGDEAMRVQYPDEDVSNPWSAIAYSWGAFDRNKNKIRNESPSKRPTPPPSPVYMGHFDYKHYDAVRPYDVISKLDRKRRHNIGSDKLYSSEDSDTENYWSKKRKAPRMRMHADDLEDKMVLVDKRLRESRSKSKRHIGGDTEATEILLLKSRLQNNLSKPTKIRVKKEKRSDDESGSESKETSEVGDSGNEFPDLRVAVMADRSPSPPPRVEEQEVEHDPEYLMRQGKAPVKSILRGARAHDTNDEDTPVLNRGDVRDERKRRKEDEKSSKRRHRSRSKERRMRHRSKEKSNLNYRDERDYHHHRSRRRKDSLSRRHRSDEVKDDYRGKVLQHNKDLHYKADEYDSDEVMVQPNAKDLRQKIISNNKRREHNRDGDDKRYSNKSGGGGGRIERDHDREQHCDRYSKHHERYEYKDDINNSNEKSLDKFRPKSPLQIEIDNDEYYRLIDSS